MNYQTYLPAISLLGGIIGIAAFMSLWTQDMTGLDLISSPYTDFQKYVPLIALILCIAAIGLSAFSLILGTIWFVPFLVLMLGVIVLAVTSVFTMWYHMDVKMAQGIGVWISYLSGAVVMLGSIIQYNTALRNYRKVRSFL